MLLEGPLLSFPYSALRRGSWDNLPYAPLLMPFPYIIQNNNKTVLHRGENGAFWATNNFPIIVSPSFVLTIK